MARRNKESDLRVGGLSVAARFTLFMTLALAPLLTLSGWMLYKNTAKVTDSVLENSMVEAVKIRAEDEALASSLNRARVLALHYRDIYIDVRERNTERLKEYQDAPDSNKQKSKLTSELNAAEVEYQHYEQELRREVGEAKKNAVWRSISNQARDLDRVKVGSVVYGKGNRPGVVYQYKSGDQVVNMVVPDVADEAGKGLLGLILSSTLGVMLVAAVVAAWVGSQVGRPIQEIVGDVRQISTGDFSHRTRVKAGGEVAVLARTIDRMATSLGEAQDTKLELQMREREVEVASEVREALLADSLPEIQGFEVGAVHLPSEEMSGDFHDFIELADGRVGLLVCDVSGDGVPGTLVGATARAYLRTELLRGGDVREAFETVNRYLARDVRRGMYVSALYALVDPRASTAHVVCAGHKIPLVRFSGSDKKVRLIQPEGIALAFDKGPIFERALKVQEIPLEPGDRLVLANTGAVELRNPDGVELGEKELYKRIMRHGGNSSEEFLERMRTVLESFADGSTLDRDASLVTIGKV